MIGRKFGNSKYNDISNIVYKDVKKSLNLNNSEIEVILKGVSFGVVNGNEKILDESMVNERISDILKTIQRTSTKYNPIPKKITIYNNQENYDEKIENNQELDNKLISIYDPSWNFDDLYMKDSDRESILTALAMQKYKDILFNKWGIKGNKENGRAICLNFWGKPGTGKSITAEAVANYLNKNVLLVNYSELESKYVGETPKNIKNIFKIAKENGSVIVFDEADSFLGKRLTNVTQSADYGVNITRSVMLIELDNFDGVVIFTTNLLTNYDEAFKRRILANIEFKLPNEEGRKKIWESHLSEKMPIDDGVNSSKLAKEFDGISGADIKDIVLFAATRALEEKRDFVNWNDFLYGNDIVKKRYYDQEVIIKTERITEEEYLRETANNTI